jgi:hypothetical protein
MKYHLKKIDTSFHQPLPNMVQRLFADVISDAIWFMNIHEQNHPSFLKNIMCIFFQFLPHISISMSLKSFSIYIVKFFELYISAVLLPNVL